MARRKPPSKLPAPFLQRLTLKDGKEDLPAGYPFDLPWLINNFEITFTQPVTILIGENGSGKSTLIEAIAGLSGYDEAGGGNGYAPTDHSTALDRNGAGLGDHLRAGWLPRITDGWFFRAESFFTVARYLDEAAREGGGAAPDYLSHSHGEGFVRFFEERMSRQGIYFLDEPESALSPRRQIDLLKLLAKVQSEAVSQVIMATHSPLLMAVPGADLLRVHHRGLMSVDLRDTDHFRLYQSLTLDPVAFVKAALADDLEGLI